MGYKTVRLSSIIDPQRGNKAGQHEEITTPSGPGVIGMYNKTYYTGHRYPRYVSQVRRNFKGRIQRTWSNLNYGKSNNYRILPLPITKVIYINIVINAPLLIEGSKEVRISNKEEVLVKIMIIGFIVRKYLTNKTLILCHKSWGENVIINGNNNQFLLY